MATEVKLQPGWLTRDINVASKRAQEWEKKKVSSRDSAETGQKSGASGKASERESKKSA